MENLFNLIISLRIENEQLQEKIYSVQKAEFQALEKIKKMSEELQVVKNTNESLRIKIEKVRKEEQELQGSSKMKDEIERPKDTGEKQINNILFVRQNPDEKSKSNIFTPELSVLLQDLNLIKQIMEEERFRYEQELKKLQERLQKLENNSQEEVLKERLKLVEAELQQAISRAESAEKKLSPSPPPPPPLPLLASLNQPPIVRLRLRNRANSGVPESTPKPGTFGVNNNIVNAIKDGQFTLRKLKKNKSNNNITIEEKETPTAVTEMLNIWKNLRQTPKKRQSQYRKDEPKNISD